MSFIKKIFSQLLLLFVFAVNVSGQISSFQKTFGGAGSDATDWSKGTQTLDGGYIIAGTTSGFGAGDHDIYLIKTDGYGKLQWSETFGGTMDDRGYCVQQTADSGFVISGWTTSFGAGGMDIYVVKTDKQGILQWSKTYGGAMDEQGMYIRQTSDGGFVVTGVTGSFGVGGSDAFLLKTDVNGNLSWMKTYGGSPFYDYGNSVQQTTDGGYIIGGLTYSFGAGNLDIYLIKTDASGNATWTKTFGGADYDYCTAAEQTADGGYILTGWVLSYGAGSEDAFLLKTDGSGTLQWMKTFGGTGEERLYSVKQTIDGGYIATGGTNSFGSGYNDVYLIKTSATGNKQWTKSFGSANGNDYGKFVRQTTDKGYIIFGQSDSFGAGMEDVYLIKTDSSGNSGCNQKNISTVISSPLPSVSSDVTVTSSSPSIATPVTIQSNPASLEMCQCSANINISYSISICNGESIVLSASGNGTYLWNTGATTSSITVTPASSVKYCAIITNACGISTDSIFITVRTKLIINAGPDYTINQGESVSLYASGAISYTWSPSNGLSCISCQNPVVSPPSTSTFIVTGADANGCTGNDTLIIIVNPDCFTVFVPGSFTPNEDGKNDVFYVYGDCIKNFYFAIFDRWGNKFFESPDVNIGWEGNYKSGSGDSRGIQEDVFVYYLKAISLNGEMLEQRGRITLIR